MDRDVFNKRLRDIRDTTSTSESRAREIYGMLNPSLTRSGGDVTSRQLRRIPVKLILEAISYHEGKREYHDAASIAEGAGMPKIAIVNYVKAGDGDVFSHVEEFAAKKGQMKYLRQVCSDLIQFHLARGDSHDRLWNAANAARIAGKIEEAVGYLAKMKHARYLQDAAELAYENGRRDLAIPLYARLVPLTKKEGYYGSAAEFARRAGLKDEAKKLEHIAGVEEMRRAEGSGFLHQALEIAKKLGLEDRVKAYQLLLKPIPLEPKHA